MTIVLSGDKSFIRLSSSAALKAAIVPFFVGVLLQLLCFLGSVEEPYMTRVLSDYKSFDRLH